MATSSDERSRSRINVGTVVIAREGRRSGIEQGQWSS
jgi:hypothetical protein